MQILLAIMFKIVKTNFEVQVNYINWKMTKNNNLNDNPPRYESKDNNRQQTLSPLKSRFYNENITNIILKTM